MIYLTDHVPLAACTHTNVNCLQAIENGLSLTLAAAEAYFGQSWLFTRKSSLQKIESMYTYKRHRLVLSPSVALNAAAQCIVMHSHYAENLILSSS